MQNRFVLLISNCAEHLTLVGGCIDEQ
jgi:hypothetical protein